jgi:hypothetical protein
MDNNVNYGRLFKKIAGYALFYVGAALMFYYFVNVGLFMVNGLADLTAEIALHSIFLPMVYAILSFFVLLVAQFCLLKPDSPFEEKWFSIANLVYFGASLAFAIIILAKGLQNNALILSLLTLLPVVLEVGEIGLAAYRLIVYFKAYPHDEDHPDSEH